jgi:hypothetical protein
VHPDLPMVLLASLSICVAAAYWGWFLAKDPWNWRGMMTPEDLEARIDYDLKHDPIMREAVTRELNQRLDIIFWENLNGGCWIKLNGTYSTRYANTLFQGPEYRFRLAEVIEIPAPLCLRTDS